MGDSHFKRHLKCPVIAGVFPAFRAGSVLQNGKHESFSKSCADFPKSCAGFSAHSLLLAESTRATFILPLVGGGGGGLQEAAQKCPLPFLGFRVTKTKSWVCVHLGAGNLGGFQACKVRGFSCAATEGIVSASEVHWYCNSGTRLGRAALLGRHAELKAVF